MNNNDPTIQILYPVVRMVTPEWVINRARDIVTDHPTIYNMPVSIEDAMWILEEEGAVTFADQPRDDDEHDQFNSNAEADADVLASAGWGTDEDYGDTDERY